MKKDFRFSNIQRGFEMDIEGNNAFFLWGPRKIGKTTYLKSKFPNALFFDLLDKSLRLRLESSSGRLLREKVLAENPPVVIVDEVQKIPDLLDEIHWLLENTLTKFILCGSSARKLKRSAANLLGGRAWRYEMFPLTTHEISNFDLDRALNHGLIPQHYLDEKPEKFLEAYVMDYLLEEIQTESRLRNIPVFSRFLESVANYNGQQLNYANVARTCGVSAHTVREYYQILEDTLLGFRLSPWTKSTKFKLVETERFYLFDSGLVRALRGMHPIVPKTDVYGHAFEQFILQEIRAYIGYNGKRQTLSFWRTQHHIEVDIIVGQMDLAIEIKSNSDIKDSDLKGLMALQEDCPVKQRLIVYKGEDKRLLKTGILAVPWQEFCKDLWKGVYF